MIYKAKFKYPLYRFLSDKGEGLKILVSLNGLDVEANTYKYNFPIGLFGIGGPIQGSFINIIYEENSTFKDKRSFEVIEWPQQHDFIKSVILDNLIEKQSKESLNLIPKFDELNLSEDQIKELENNRLKLEKSYSEEEDHDDDDVLEDIVCRDYFFLSDEESEGGGFEND